MLYVTRTYAIAPPSGRTCGSEATRNPNRSRAEKVRSGPSLICDKTGIVRSAQTESRKTVRTTPPIGNRDMLQDHGTIPSLFQGGGELCELTIQTGAQHDRTLGLVSVRQNGFSTTRNSNGRVSKSLPRHTIR